MVELARGGSVTTGPTCLVSVKSPRRPVLDRMANVLVTSHSVIDLSSTGKSGSCMDAIVDNYFYFQKSM